MTEENELNTTGSDFSNWLTFAEENYTKSSSSLRLSIFKESPSVSEKTTEEEYGSLFQVLFATLPLYTIRVERLAMEHFLLNFITQNQPKSAPTSSPTSLSSSGEGSQHQKRVLKVFVANLTKAVAQLKNQHKAIQHQRVTLLRWSCLVFHHCSDAITDPSAFSKLSTIFINLQTTLLTSIAENEENEEQADFHHSTFFFKELFTTRRNFLELFLKQVLDSKPTPSLCYSYLLLLSNLSPTSLDKKETTPTQHLNDPKIKGRFFEIYNELIISSTTEIKKQHHLCFAPFLHSLTHEEFKSQLMPNLSRTIKRSPEVFLENGLSLLFSLLKLDLSQYTAEFFPLLAPHLKSTTNLKLRNDTALALFNLTKNSSDPTAIEAVLKSLLDLLNGTQQPPQRVGITSAINTISNLPFRKVQLANIVDALAQLVEKEGNEESKSCLITAVAKLQSAISSISPIVIKMFSSGFGASKDTFRWLFLDSLKFLIKSDVLVTKISDLVIDLCKLTKASSQQPNKRVDVVYTFRVLIKMVASDAATEAAFNKDQLWPIFTKTDSFLFSPQFVERLAEGDLLALVDGIISLITLNPDRLNPFDESHPIFSTVLSLCLHSSWKVRKEARSLLTKAHIQSPKLAGIMFKLFCNFLEGDHSKPNGILVDALHAILSKEFPRESLPLLMLVIHHCSIASSNSQSRAIWKQALAQIGIKQQELYQDEQFIRGIITLLFESNKRPLTLKNMDDTIFSCIFTLAKTGSGQTLDHLIERTKLFLDAVKLKALTKLEIGVFKTPEGQLFQKVQHEYVPQVVESKNIKRSKGEKIYKDADEKWAQETKKELEKKKKGNEPQVNKEELEAKNKLLREEAEIRNRVRTVVSPIEFGLKALKQIGDANPTRTHLSLGNLVFDLTDLLPHALVGELAGETLISLSCCVSRNLRPISELCAVTTVRYLAFPQHSLALSQKQLLEILEHILKTLHTQLEQPLPSNSFAFIFPLLEIGMLNCPISEIQDCVFDLIELHTVSAHNASDAPAPYTETSFPHIRCIALLINVIDSFPRYEHRAKDIFLCIATSFSEPDLNFLLEGFVSANVNVRLTCLQALQKMSKFSSGLILPSAFVASSIWFLCSDPESQISELGNSLYKFYNYPMGEDVLEHLYEILSIEDDELRLMVAKSLGSGISIIFQQDKTIIPRTLERLFGTYIKNKAPLSNDPKEPPPPDYNWTIRNGAALVFKELTELYNPENVESLFKFFITESLSDQREPVKQAMVQAGMEIINIHGKQNISLLLPVFESYLDQPAGQNAAQDRVRESVVVFLGSIARHMEPGEPKVMQVVDKLLAALYIPSEIVQRAVSQCLAPIMSSIKDKSEGFVNLLLERVKNGKSYGDRRGAAFGLAGVVKGIGISSLKQLNIMNSLQAMAEDKKHPNTREGALLAYECLWITLGRMFEPYVMYILPQLLNCFGDSSEDVRRATTDTARAIMGSLSEPGVKLFLPGLLKGLDDGAWRTKLKSVELLGSMSFLAPRQLSFFLPQIVPKLMDVLNDSHSKVNAAAKTALSDIGSVIRNPEIQIHVPVILQALCEPDLNTKKALEALLSTNFIHVIDPPSLALIMPILSRGLKDRSTATKKQAAQIVGNMSSLTDHKDLGFYLTKLVPNLKAVVVDPIPDVRATAARAIGSLVKGMGDENFPDLIAWLLENMKSEVGSVERSGAAQGLAEVLAHLDAAKIDQLINEILGLTKNQKPHIREGSISLFIFAPESVGLALSPYLPKILPCLLNGLSDESEPVRDAALRASQSTITKFAKSAIHVILPALEEGLFNDNWRIRQSSIQLLGDLLFKIAGTKEVSVAGEDDSLGSAESGKAIVRVLGEKKRASILAALYMIRSDPNSVVRQRALLVWKSIVDNTPRTLREILPVLMQMIIAYLANSNVEKRQVASRTLGELVQKLGERILPDIIPILEKGLESPQSDTRQGVCLGLSEVLSSASRHQLLEYLPVVIPCVRKALCDDLPQVREAAAQAFDMLHDNFGAKATIEEILPPLLAQLNDPQQADDALDGLRQIVAVRSTSVLSFLIPKLTTRPISPSQARALACLADVAGKALYYQLSGLLPAFIEGMAVGGTYGAEIKKHAQDVISQVKEDGLHLLFAEFFKLIKESDITVRKGVVELIAGFCSSTDVEMDPTALLQALVPLLNDPEPTVQVASHEALTALTKMVKKDNLPPLIPPLRASVQKLSEELQRQKKTSVPGFCLPQGIGPLLPIYLQGLMFGSPEIRAQSADGIGELINLTTDAALKPFVIQITGPLIRIIGDRFAWQVKAAILKTLSLLLDKAGIYIKSFLPPLQTTFIKALHDPTKVVRLHAATALGKLMGLAPRIDPLLNELLTGLNSNEKGVKEAILKALQMVLAKATTKIDSKVSNNLMSALNPLLDSDEDEIRKLASSALGAYSHCVDESELEPFLKKQMLKGSSSWKEQQSQLTCLTSLLSTSSQRLTPGLVSAIIGHVSTFFGTDKVPVKETACSVVGNLILCPEQNWQQSENVLISFLSASVSDPSGEVRLAALNALKKFAKLKPEVAGKHLATLIPPVMERIKDRASLSAKLCAERVLLHLLQLYHSNERLDKYLSTVDAQASKTLSDYVKRVISKLGEQSDEEDLDSESTGE